MINYQENFLPDGFFPLYQDPPPLYTPPHSSYPFPPIPSQPLYNEPSFQAQPLQVYININPTPIVDLDLKSTQRAEWLEKKGAWKWETAGKIALIAVIILGGASLFAFAALPGGLALFGIVFGTAGSFLAILFAISIAACEDWTNYANAETVEKILERAKNSNTPLNRTLLNNLERYGIISKAVYNELTTLEYENNTGILQNSLHQMEDVALKTSRSFREERCEINNQLHFSTTLPETKKIQQKRKKAMDDEKEQFAKAQADAEKAKAYFAQVHGKIIQFKSKPGE